MYYFVAFASLFGWPVLICGEGGVFALVREVRKRMFGGLRYAHMSLVRLWILISEVLYRRTLITVVLSTVMAVTIKFFTSV